MKKKILFLFLSIFMILGIALCATLAINKHQDKSVKKVHPAYIYKKNDKKNEYNIIQFTSAKGKKELS